jgi:arylsulfatase A-like enzyme
MADVFAAGGYRTGIFGKWHLGDNFPFRPQDRGFQEVFVHGGGGVGQTPDYWGNKYFDDTYFRNGRPVKVSGYCTDVWFAAALEFIEASKDRPFFAYIPTNAAHGPHRVPEKYRALYTGKTAAFYGMITNIDENVGRLMERLDALGLAEGTILVFLTDNGVSVGWVAGLRGTKSGPYEGGHRVPCFIRYPAGGLAGGRDIARLASHVDLLPTLADLCGLAPPKGVRLDGTSLVPLLSGAADWPDRALVVDSQRIEHPQQWRNSCVMTDRWRLVNGKELYDIRADLGQREDVAAAQGAEVARLRAAYEAWWADTSKRFDEFCPIVLGSDREDPSRLTAHDWHAPNVPWNQPSILGGAAVNGFWAVEVERDGQYDLELRRWPAEADLAITAAPAGGKAVRATAARAKIGPFDETKPVEPGAKTVTFRAALKAGPARLETWLLDGDQAPRGAYYVYVRRRA